DRPLASQKTATKSAGHVKIVQFYASEPTIPKGTKGNLCYGVENAVKLELDPPADDAYPAVSRCIEISPRTKTTYTLTAYGKDGGKETKSAEVNAGAALP